MLILLVLLSSNSRAISLTCVGLLYNLTCVSVTQNQTNVYWIGNSSYDTIGVMQPDPALRVDSSIITGHNQYSVLQTYNYSINGDIMHMDLGSPTPDMHLEVIINNCQGWRWGPLYQLCYTQGYFNWTWLQPTAKSIHVSFSLNQNWLELGQGSTHMDFNDGVLTNTKDGSNCIILTDGQYCQMGESLMMRMDQDYIMVSGAVKIFQSTFNTPISVDSFGKIWISIGEIAFDLTGYDGCGTLNSYYVCMNFVDSFDLQVSKDGKHLSLSFNWGDEFASTGSEVAGHFIFTNNSYPKITYQVL